MLCSSFDSLSRQETTTRRIARLRQQRCCSLALLAAFLGNLVFVSRQFWESEVDGLDPDELKDARQAADGEHDDRRGGVASCGGE